MKSKQEQGCHQQHDHHSCEGAAGVAEMHNCACHAVTMERIYTPVQQQVKQDNKKDKREQIAQAMPP